MCLSVCLSVCLSKTQPIIALPYYLSGPAAGVRILDGRPFFPGLLLVRTNVQVCWGSGPSRVPQGSAAVLGSYDVDRRKKYAYEQQQQRQQQQQQQQQQSLLRGIFFGGSPF